MWIRIDKHNEQVEALRRQIYRLEEANKELHRKLDVKPPKEYTLTFQDKRQVVVVGDDYSTGMEGFCIFRRMNGELQAVQFFTEKPTEWTARPI